MVLVKYIFFFLLIINFNVSAKSLTDEEIIYFNFIDLNNDEKISYQEADQIIQIIFKLLDINNDDVVTKDEVLDLKYIIENLS